MMLVGLLTTSYANALFNIPQLSSPSLNSLAMDDQTLAKTGLKENEDDVLPEQEKSTFKLSEEQLHEAKVWGLTESEEKRYVHLMQNKSAVYYKGLDLTPVDILGINARTESERNHFAELGAKQEALKVTKSIAWNNAFYRAYNELFKDVPVIDEAFDPKPYGPLAYEPISLKTGDALYWFIET